MSLFGDLSDVDTSGVLKGEVTATFVKGEMTHNQNGKPVFKTQFKIFGEKYAGKLLFPEFYYETGVGKEQLSKMLDATLGHRDLNSIDELINKQCKVVLGSREYEGKTYQTFVDYKKYEVSEI